MPEFIEPIYDQCPAPGGCASCFDRSYCAGLRIGLGMTRIWDEFVDGQSPTTMIFQEKTDAQE